MKRKEFTRRKFITTVSAGSGTQSLNTAVEALGIGPCDEIITSPNTDPGTIQSILVSCALPVTAVDRRAPGGHAKTISYLICLILALGVWGSSDVSAGEWYVSARSGASDANPGHATVRFGRSGRRCRLPDRATRYFFPQECTLAQRKSRLTAVRD